MNLPTRASAPQHATFYFDFRDPYAYLAWTRVPRLVEAAGGTLTLAPIDSHALGHRGGLTGPLATDALREYLWRDAAARAEAMGVPFKAPERFPFDSRPLLATCLYVRDRSGQEAMAAVADTIWRRIWSEGADPEDCQTARLAAREVALPEAALRAACEDERTSALLDRITERAAERGVVTVPTLDVEGELHAGFEELARLEEEWRRQGGLGAEGSGGEGSGGEGQERPRRGGGDMPDWTFSG